MKLRNSKEQVDAPFLTEVKPKVHKKSAIWKHFRNVCVVLFLTFLSISYYYYNYLRVTGVVIVKANKITLASQGVGVVKSIIDVDGMTDVKVGQRIATLSMKGLDAFTLNRRIFDLEDMVIKQQEKITDLQLKEDTTKNDIQNRLRQLTREYELAKITDKSLDKRVKKLKEITKLVGLQSDRAQKLYELEVISLSDLNALKEKRLESQYTLDSLVEEDVENDKEIVNLKGLIDLSKKDLLRHEKKSSSAMKTQNDRLKLLQERLKFMKELKAGVYEDVDLFCPSNGKVLEVHVQSGDSIGEDSPIITFYRPEFMTMQVYIEERFMDRVQVGSNVTIRLLKENFKTKVTYINKNIVYSPKDLQGRDISSEGKYYFSAELALPGSTSRFFPGKSGLAIIH